MSKVIEMNNISKFFPGVKALENVSFDLRKGEVHCLIGANGAGKSTLMKILAGVYPSDIGEIKMNESTVEIENPFDSKKLGIATIYQELSLVDELSIAENIFLGSYNKKKNGFVNWKNLNKMATEVLGLLDENLKPSMTVDKLSMGKKQMVEIAKALATESKVLIMDEPSTALSDDEVKKLFKMINEIKSQGISIIYISHKLEELFKIGDRITILRNGRKIITEEINNINKNTLIEHIVGKHIQKTANKPNEIIERETYLKINKFKNQKLKNVSLELGKGEILGLYGLEGAGRTELLRAIYGADSLDKGDIVLNEKKYNIKKPDQAVKAGIGLVPEKRKTEGIIGELSLLENATLPSLNSYSKLSFLNYSKIKEDVKKNIKKLNIKAKDENVLIKNLSGGNQQKVIISKWLQHQSKIILFDEPTQGIDIGAKDEIYRLIKELREYNDTSVIIASSEIDELISISDRVLVMYEGEIIKEFNEPVNQKNNILNCAVTGENKDGGVVLGNS